jgi:hypothetical protein
VNGFGGKGIDCRYSCPREAPTLTSVIVRVRVTLQLTVSQSVCLGVEPPRYLLLLDSYGLVLRGGGALSDERTGLSCVLSQSTVIANCQ